MLPILEASRANLPVFSLVDIGSIEEGVVVAEELSLSWTEDADSAFRRPVLHRVGSRAVAGADNGDGSLDRGVEFVENIPTFSEFGRTYNKREKAQRGQGKGKHTKNPGVQRAKYDLSYFMIYHLNTNSQKKLRE